MDSVTAAVVAGAAGAATTTLLHEVTRRLVPAAPRVDLLGMQAVAKTLHATGADAPEGSALYNLTLAGDLVSNTLYFGTVGVVPPARARGIGTVLGVLAGIGAVVLPGPLGLSTAPTERTNATKAMAVALYTAGGIAAGRVYTALVT